jgi:NAD(P)H-hydrate epimerase
MAERVITVAEMREREERTWATGVLVRSVQARAGAAVARVAQRWTRPGAPVLVLVGRGHNGSDAALAARGLTDRSTETVRLGSARSFSRAREWLARHDGRRDALVVDGLFGIGLNRPVEGEWGELIRAVNGSGIGVVSVDVPSGLNADTGEAMGETVEAWVTVTLGAVKRGLLRETAARWVGRLELASDIGLVGDDVPGGLRWVEAADFAGFPPRRPDGGHKGTFGHVGLVAGSEGYQGAAVLAARGAQRARPGLVTLWTEPSCWGPVASQLPSVMVRPWRGESWVDTAPTAWVVGPGMASRSLSPAMVEAVRRLWREASVPVVADASALDWIGGGGGEVAGVRVITPHPGEAARMLGTTSAEVQGDREGAMEALAGRCGGSSVWVVLKGRHTMIRGPGGDVWVNSSGNPGLGQGGTGDVLAGYLGGGLAQAAGRLDWGLTLRHAVWRHGAAADTLEASGRAWTTEELVEELGWVTPGGEVGGRRSGVPRAGDGDR